MEPKSYLIGVIMGINAIKDSYLWADSPDCFFMKVDHIQGNHDLNSDLRKSNGNHRVFSTVETADNVINNRNSELFNSLYNICSKDFTNVVFLSSMPMSQVVGVDYDKIIRSVKEYFPDKNIFNIPSKAMTDCWLDGYSDLLFSLAKNIDISNAYPGRNKVAIVGNLFDRNEGDSRGNIEEFKKIIEGLGLELTTIWLEGNSYNDLLKIKEASTIISLPYGRKAAKKIANRLNVSLLELDLPFGFNNTIEFIKSLGDHFNISKNIIDTFLNEELKLNNDIGIIKYTIGEIFLGKNISYYGDPYLLKGIQDISQTLGLEINEVFINGCKKHTKNDKYDCINTENIDKSINLFIASESNLFPLENKNKVELGFPSYYYHVFSNQPYLGIRGTVNFINRLFNKLDLQKNER